MKILFFAAIFLSFILSGCSSAIPNRDVTGETFPGVKGKSLAGKEFSIPEDFKGEMVIIVLGYVQKTQFDIDRWGIGFFTSDLDLPPVYELPTISGLIPTLISGTIDEGMRDGIPEESWKDVITIYGADGSKIKEWTGTTNPNNGRIILLDENGKVLWFYDRGYGLPPLQELLNKIKEHRKK